MKRKAIWLALAAALVLTLPAAAEARSNGVGLGVSIGAVFPNSDNLDMDEVGLAWGFWVDIPIAWKFHISPSAELYNLGGSVDENTATDICLNFKFIVPLSFMRVFFGAGGGVTNAMNQYNPNAGLLGGVSFRLISNLEAFVALKYKILINDDVGNVHMLHANAGAMFIF